MRKWQYLKESLMAGQHKHSSSIAGVESMQKEINFFRNPKTQTFLQTSGAKLLNALVTYQVGRDYFNDISMVELLTWKSSELIYDSMADHLIAVMQKLSLNKIQLHDMLQKGLLQWLINHMQEVQFLASTFHLECMSDLLRMLMDAENAADSIKNVPHLIIVLGERFTFGHLTFHSFVSS